MDEGRHLFSPLMAEGRHLLTLGALGLLFAGAFGIFLGLAGQFLPHDIQFLGMTAQQLCSHNACTIVHFMIHDRVSFGGTLVALAILYLWLIHFPLRAGEAWAWWTMLISNVAGFLSFLMYLQYGYLDTWHLAATLVLLPCFAGGLAKTWRALKGERGVSVMLRAGERVNLRTRQGVGRAVVIGVAVAMIVAGVTISVVGMTVVFVPQDLEYMQTTRAALDGLNPRLIPLIAHDRAGFGAGVLNVGFLMLMAMCCGRPTVHRWEAMGLAGGIGYVMAIGIHPWVGYNNPVHLGPAIAGAAVYFVGMGMMSPGVRKGEVHTSVEAVGGRGI